MANFLLDRDTWQEVGDSLGKNKLRSVLTMVGVWWGILLLIGLLGSARGIENIFNVLFQNFDTNSVFIIGGKTTMPFKGFVPGKPIRLNLQDVDAIKSNVPGVNNVLPRNQGTETLSRNEKSGSFTGTGDLPLLNQLAKPNITSGRFINQRDIDDKRKVILISEDIYKQLFEKDVDPIGETIMFGKLNFTVIGIYQYVNLGGPRLEFHIPFTTFQQIYNRGGRVDWLMVTGERDADINQIDSDTRLLLKNLKNVHPEDNRAITGFNLGDRFARFTNFLKGMQFLTWFVGIATLIAGVFAIGSILLITVKERTNEIGIRRALGATPFIIKRQIVIESLTISLIAGIIGIICGGLTLMALNSKMENSESPFMLNPSVPIGIVFLSLLIVIVLGVLIGLIPANKATSVKPIDALREE